MGTHVYTKLVTPAFEKLFNEATRVYQTMEKRDGIKPFDRVVAELLRMYAASKYRQRHTVKRVKREYWMGAFLPTHPMGTPKRLRMEVVDVRDGDISVLDSISANVFAAVRHDLTIKHDIGTLTLPDNGTLVAGAYCFVAAVASRRWKDPIGIKYLPIVKG